jgi:hypothetical protein
VMAHGDKEVFTPTRHPWFSRGNNCLATQKETSLVLLDHKVFQSARLYDFPYRERPDPM